MPRLGRACRRRPARGTGGVADDHAAGAHGHAGDEGVEALGKLPQGPVPARLTRRLPQLGQFGERASDGGGPQVREAPGDPVDVRGGDAEGEAGVPEVPILWGGRNGEAISLLEAAPKDLRPSDVHWLTPRTWIDVGLRGHTRGGMPQPGWAGRLEDRNVAFVRLLTSSGLRRGEGGSLLLFELPVRGIGGGRYCRGKAAAAVTRSKRPRTFYVAADALGDVEAYIDSSRAWVVRRPQQAGRYERLARLRLVYRGSAWSGAVVAVVERAGDALSAAILGRCVPYCERPGQFAGVPAGSWCLSSGSRSRTLPWPR